MKVYLSGPITGRKDYHELFARAAAYVGHLGDVEILNPATFEGMPGWRWADWILFDLSILSGADMLVSLPGSDGSAGAQVEQAFAAGAGIPIVDIADARAAIAAFTGKRRAG